jgi:hypothetical protein
MKALIFIIIFGLMLMVGLGHEPQKVMYLHTFDGIEPQQLRQLEEKKVKMEAEGYTVYWKKAETINP